MSRLQCRGSIAGAAVLVVLLSSSPADAQLGIDPGPPREPGGLWNNFLTGVQYDIVNQGLAEHRLHHLQAKLRRDAERGDMAAVDRDVCRIDNVKYRIAMDEWLIRWNSLQNPGFYTIRTDAVSRAAIAQAASPAQIPYLPQVITTVGTMATVPLSAARTIPITIVNAEAAGANVAFDINGITHQAAAGSRQNLNVAPDANITYDGGGSLGQRRYRLSQGLYEFRLTAEGWALYKLSDTP